MRSLAHPSQGAGVLPFKANIRSFTSAVRPQNASKMARRAVLSSQEPSDQDEELASMRQRNGPLGSPSPAASFSSDKENRGVSATGTGKGKARSMAPPSKLPTPDSAGPASERASKRRRISERDALNATEAALEQRLDLAGDASVYDPDQSIEERRVIRKDYRDLSRELTGLGAL